MAARRSKPPRQIERTPAVEVKDEQTDRALTLIRQHLDRLDAARKRDSVTVDLVVGTNRVRHGLGRAVTGYSVVPTVASAAFAHALDVTNPRPELEVWIEVVGASQPDARIEVW
jgi:hypothetical protein